MSGENAVEEYLKSIGKTRKELFESLRGVTGKKRTAALKEYRAAKNAVKEANTAKRREKNKNKNKKPFFIKKEQRKQLIEEAKKNNLIPDLSNLQTKSVEDTCFIRKGVYLFDECDIVVIYDQGFPQVSLPFQKKENLRSKFESFCSTSLTKPSIGAPFVFGGVYVIVCHNTYSKKLLHDFIGSNNNPLEDGTRLMISGAELLHKYFLVKINFPGERIDQNKFFKKLTVQNPHLKVEEWNLKSTSNQPNGFQCLFNVPEVTFKALAFASFTVCYNLEAIKVILVVDNTNLNTTLNYSQNTRKLNNCKKGPYKPPYKPPNKKFLPERDPWMGYR